MTPKDREQFAQIWFATHEVYGKRVSDAATEIAFSALAGYDLPDIQRALSRHVQDPDTGQFAPKPADIVKYISGDSQSRVGEAWAKVDFAIRSIGPYRSVVFDDPWIHAAIEKLGGWIKVCDVSSDELPFLQNKFEKLYKGFKIAPPENHRNKLIGVADHQNSQLDSPMRGRVKEQITFVGDRDKARQVYKLGNTSTTTAITHGHAEGVSKQITDKAKRIGHRK